MNDIELNNQPSWVWVFGLNEFLSSLKVEDLKQISTLCHKIRKQSNYFLFKNVEFATFSARTKGFSKCVIGDNPVINNSMELIEFHLHPFVPHVASLGFGQDIRDAMLLSIPTIFHNLKYLKLDSLLISLPSLYQLAQGFQSLESLSLHCIIIFVWLDKEPSLIQFKFPESLKRLDIVYCKQLESDFNPDLLTQNYRNVLQTRNPQFCYFLGHCLPNIEELQLIDPAPECITMQNEFLTLSPHLKSLGTGYHLFNQTGLNYLEKLHYLTNLELYFGFELPQDSIELKIPTLNHIKLLKIYIKHKHALSSVKKFCLSCPNTTHLSFSFLQSFKICLNEVVNVLKHLESLTIFNRGSTGLFLDMIMLRNQVKTIQLALFDPLTINLKKFDNCDQLRQVIIKLRRSERPDMDKAHSHFNKFEGWNCLMFNDSIQCYKVD